MNKTIAFSSFPKMGSLVKDAKNISVLFIFDIWKQTTFTDVSTSLLIAFSVLKIWLLAIIFPLEGICANYWIQSNLYKNKMRHYIIPITCLPFRVVRLAQVP